MFSWIILGAVGLIMTSLSLVLLWNAIREEPPTSLRDADALSEAFAKWRDFVLKRNGTHRALKGFENRARWLATYKQPTLEGEQSEWINKLVGLVALEVTGAIDSSDSGLNFLEWKKEKWPAVACILSNDCKEIIDNCVDNDWKHYRALAAGAEFEDSTG